MSGREQVLADDATSTAHRYTGHWEEGETPDSGWVASHPLAAILPLQR
jgi:hypothetical protein